MWHYFLLIAISALLNANRLDGFNTWNADSLLDMKIRGGNQANIASTPYQVSVRLNDNHICGGSIIANNFVLTAAHCISKNQWPQCTVQYGVDKIGSSTNVVKAAKIITHEKFSSASLDYDVALIKLATAIKLDNNAKVIPLAVTDPAAGTNAIIAGWGQTVANGPIVKELQSLNLKIVAQKECSEKFKNVHKLTDRMICAGANDGKGTCVGDSGGPLAVNGQQVGIASWGAGCGQPNYPGAYSSVATLRSWITANMK